MNIRERIGKEILFFDGAMGTQLQAAGLPQGELPENWNFTHREIVREIHTRYLEAGCHIIKTNSFGANRYKGGAHGLDSVEAVKAAVSIAREAIGGRSGRYVALDIGPTGKLMEPMGDLTFEGAYEAFSEMVIAGRDAGADCVLIETMSDTYEIKAAVLAAKENCDLPVFVTVVFEKNGRLLTGADIPSVVALLEGLRVDALGLNCGFGPDQMLLLLEELKKVCSIPVIVNPNAGLPENVDGKTVFRVEPEGFAKTMKKIVEAGAWMVGGCCGTTPDHLRAEVELCGKMMPKPLPRHAHTVVTSPRKTVFFTDAPILIGERINPTGRPDLQKALAEGDFETLLDEALSQQDEGAQILDVNTASPEGQETTFLPKIVQELQNMVALPLSLDTANPAAMEAALRIYNGKPLINSVTGRKNSLDAILPLVKKYGGVLVALTLDEDGIPETAEKRLAVAEKILAEARKYGIRKCDILFDALTLAAGSTPASAQVTLETLTLLKMKLGVKTVLGVSNVSFGLPNRPLLNSSFLLLALQAGLDAAIVNTGSRPIQDALVAFGVLSGKDTDCAGYLAANRGK